MYRGYNKIFWGIFIITFNIKLGVLKILPSFIGFVIVSRGIDSLYEESHIETFNRAKIFAAIITITIATGELMEFLSIDLIKTLLLNEVWIVFNSIIEVLMFYKYFEGSIEYFHVNDNESLAEENIKKLRLYIIVSIMGIIFLNFALIFNIESVITISAIMIIVLRIYLMVSTYRFRNTFTE